MNVFQQTTTVVRNPALVSYPAGSAVASIYRREQLKFFERVWADLLDSIVSNMMSSYPL